MTLTSVRASNSICLEIDCVISISRKKGGSICNEAMTVDLSNLDTVIDCSTHLGICVVWEGETSALITCFLNLDVCVTDLEACKNARISSRGVAK
jgi:hypothetical protein